MKDYKGREKGLLRYASSDLLPENILWRKKSPYPKTHNPAYLGAVIAGLEKILSDKDSPLFAIADYDAVSSLLYTARKEPWYGQLMTVPQIYAFMLQLDKWLKAYDVRISN